MNEHTDANSIPVINVAANSFGSPSEYACQLTTERQVKAAQSMSVVKPAARSASRRPPLSIQNPQNALSVPKAPPDISAVFAASGLEA